MALGEADTRAKLIDPALHARGWTEDLIRREETAGAVEVIDGRPRRLDVPLAYASNGHLFVECDRISGLTRTRRPES